VEFRKYHGLGNDYLVLDPGEVGRELEAREIRRICDRNYGVGADGLLWGPLPAEGGFGLRIFNPDGGEAEKSGNGVRIFARCLFDRGLVRTAPFVVVTKGGQSAAWFIRAAGGSTPSSAG
jgi:diaminopimelate epimerase